MMHPYGMYIEAIPDKKLIIIPLPPAEPDSFELKRLVLLLTRRFVLKPKARHRRRSGKKTCVQLPLLVRTAYVHRFPFFAKNIPSYVRISKKKHSRRYLAAPPHGDFPRA